MSDEGEQEGGTKGIVLGPGARDNWFGKVFINGADTAIEDHGTGNTFGTVRLTEVGVGVEARGQGLRIDDLFIRSNVELARMADRGAVKDELAKVMPEPDAKVALEILDDLKAQAPDASMLDVIEANPIYRTARVVAGAVGLFKVLSLLY
jgi:hypothetical protein